MTVDESLSYFTKALKIKSLISEELESVANNGLSRDGFVEVARCKVEACRDTNKSIKREKYRIKNLFFEAIISGKC